MSAVVVDAVFIHYVCMIDAVLMQLAVCEVVSRN